jgi:hypothetical protein
MKVSLFILLFASSVYSQTWTPEMQKFADYTEKRYNLPKGTCRVFALKESNYNQYAERVEANYVEKTGTYAANIRRDAYKFSKEHNWQPSVLTEIYQRGKSPGMFQVMGQNLRDMGYNEPYMSRFSLTDQFEYFGIFISRLFKKHNGNFRAVAAEYNGGYGAVLYKVKHGRYRNQDYVDKIEKYYNLYGK